MLEIVTSCSLCDSKKIKQKMQLLYKDSKKRFLTFSLLLKAFQLFPEASQLFHKGFQLFNTWSLLTVMGVLIKSQKEC